MFWLWQWCVLVGVVLTAPVWLLLLWYVPKTRAGFWQKCGIWSAQQQQHLAAWRQEHLPSTIQPKTIWIHAVSVGEFLAVKPLITQLLEQQLRVIVSTTTRTGQQLAQEAFGVRAMVCYFPFDVVWAVDSFMKRLQPDAILITETELWPTFMQRVGKRFGVPVFLINGRISDKSFRRYQWIKRIVMQPLLRCFRGLYMQSIQDAQRVTALGALPERVKVWGNLKLDLPMLAFHREQTALGKIWFFSHENDYPILTLASTHAGEERLLIEAVCLPLWQQFPHLKVVLAPRHPERVQEVATLLEAYGVAYQKRSEAVLIQSVNAISVMPEQPPLLLLDTVGELKTIFGFSTVAVVAGSFLPTLGGHNALEPIAMQVPTVFGCYTSNFAEITQLILSEAAGIQVPTVAELLPVITRLLTDETERSRLVAAGNRFLAQHQGNTQRLLTALLEQL